MDKHYVTAKSIAGLFPVSITTLAKWRSLKKGPPYYKMGKTVAYVVEEVTAWVEGQRVKTSS